MKCVNCGYKVEKFDSFESLIKSRRILHSIMKTVFMCKEFRCNKKWSIIVHKVEKRGENNEYVFEITFHHEFMEDQQTYFWICRIRPVYNDLVIRNYRGASEWEYNIEPPKVTHTYGKPIDAEIVKLQEAQIVQMITFA